MAGLMILAGVSVVGGTLLFFLTYLSQRARDKRFNQLHSLPREVREEMLYNAAREANARRAKRKGGS